MELAVPLTVSEASSGAGSSAAVAPDAEAETVPALLSKGGGKPLALLHLLLNELLPLVLTWVSTYTFVLGAVNRVGVNAVDERFLICTQVSSCVNQLAQRSMWISHAQVQCEYTPEALRLVMNITQHSESNLIHTDAGTLINYFVLAGVAVVYLVTVSRFLYAFPMLQPLNGEYIRFVLRTKRSRALRAYVWLTVLFVLGLACYATYIVGVRVSAPLQGLQLLVAAVLTLTSLLAMLPDTSERDVLDIESAEFRCIIVQCFRWTKFFTKFNADSMRRDIEMQQLTQGRFDIPRLALMPDADASDREEASSGPSPVQLGFINVAAAAIRSAEAVQPVIEAAHRQRSSDAHSASKAPSSRL